MKMMKSTLNRMMGAAIVSMLFTGIAIADEARVYPDSMCQGVDQQDEAYLDHGEGVVSTSADVWVSCPIVDTTPSSTASVHGYVRVYHPNTATAALTCHIQNHSWDGRKKEVGFGGHAREYGTHTSFDVFSPDTSFKSGSLELACFIPKGGSIFNYVVFE